jgi:hypothetical protein
VSTSHQQPPVAPACVVLNEAKRSVMSKLKKEREKERERKIECVMSRQTRTAGPDTAFCKLASPSADQGSVPGDFKGDSRQTKWQGAGLSGALDFPELIITSPRNILTCDPPTRYAIGWTKQHIITLLVCS